MLNRRLLNIIAALCICSAAIAQNGILGHPSWQIKPVYHSGFIMVHRTSIGHLVKGYPSIFELNISKPTLGNKIWHLENNLPDIGVSLQYMDYKNPSQLGYAYTIAPYIEVPLNHRDRMATLHMRLCWGATYITRSFDIHKNHKNVAIGSPVNCFAQFKWFWHIRLNEKLRFEPGICFTHASNGRARNPNLGLNVISVSAGLNYLIGKKNPVTVTAVDSSTRVRSKNELVLIAATGVNERGIDGITVKTGMVSVAYQRNVRNTHKFCGGLDFFYDENYTLDYNEAFRRMPTGLEGMRVSAKLGYSYNAGRVSFPIELGYYVFQKINPDAMIVSRLGVRYYAANGIVGHFGLRTHFAVAYNFEFGLGYRIFLK